MINQNNQQYSM